MMRPPSVRPWFSSPLPPLLHLPPLPLLLPSLSSSVSASTSWSSSSSSSSSSSCCSPLCVSSSAFRPSPRNCSTCPLFATCRKHTPWTSRQPTRLDHGTKRRSIGTLARADPALLLQLPQTPESGVSPTGHTTSSETWTGQGKGKAKDEQTTSSIKSSTSTKPDRSSSSSSNQDQVVSGRDTVAAQVQTTIDVVSEQVSKPPSRRRPLQSRKQVITLSLAAIEHLAQLVQGPHPKLIRVGVKNKGCAGMSYHLSYVDAAEPFDEVVEEVDPTRPGQVVKVVIDSKALFSIIGSEMDWEEGRMGSRFIFRNPNVKEQCGCGESFTV